MKRVQISVILSILFLGVLHVSAKEVTIDELNKWIVVTKPNAIESEKYAAEEFRSIYKLATGVSLKMADAVPASGGYIMIGQSDAVKTEDLGEEGLRIVIAPMHIIITGGRPRGALYGVYEFFEKYLDVQFLSAEHTYIPENIATVKIPCETYSYVTPFSFRWAYLAENNTNHKFAT